MATYYKKIKGKKYDGRLLKKADSSVKGRGDGRISLKDARGILAMVKDSDEYSAIEKNTIRYIRDNYAFTTDADRWFRTQIRKWAATKKTGAKKSAAKPAKKGVKKPKPARKRVPKKMTLSEKRQEERDREELLALQEASRSTDAPPQRSSLPKKLGIIIILLGIVLFGLWFNPSTREWIKERCPAIAQLCEKKSERAEEAQAPVAEVETVTVPEEQPAEVKPVEQKPAEAVPEEEGDFYIVQVKDNLVSIAEKELGHYSRWVDIYRLNRAAIPGNFHLYPGQKLKMPKVEKK
ncbi:MAG: hypothetical protein JW807_08815 [Spirochaetes bacterium]|nr:hypothetical protein [Spirochaetota bacterium]